MTQKGKQRKQVRVECPACACGYVGHMTADELKERAVNDEVDLSCPSCGMIHLNHEEIEEFTNRKVSASSRYQTMKDKAEK